MRTVNIKLPTAEAVQEFVAQISGLSGQFDLLSGKYVLDARSLMGIFSLDLLKPIDFIIHSEDESIVNAVIEDVKPWTI